MKFVLYIKDKSTEIVPPPFSIKSPIYANEPKKGYNLKENDRALSLYRSYY